MCRITAIMTLPTSCNLVIPGVHCSIIAIDRYDLDNSLFTIVLTVVDFIQIEMQAYTNLHNGPICMAR